jgi:hypothetical protein
MSDPIYPVFERIIDNSYFDWNGIQAPILTRFFGIALLDQMVFPLSE